jgi:hypothetical protein
VSDSIRLEDADRISRRRAIGAGLGMLIVVLTYGASRYEDPDRWWAAGGAVVIGVALADRLVDVRALLPTPGVAPLTIIAALAAVFLCVPETDQLPIVALVPVALVVLEIVERRQMPIEWYLVAAAAVGWGAMFGATGRQSALAGALFAWWAVLLPGFISLGWRVKSTPSALAIAGLGAVAAVVMARTGGIADTWSVVFVSAVACGGISLLAAVAIARESAAKGDAPAPIDQAG